ncbi:MAG: YceI family protein [Dehalococcoidia bacterium]
MSLRPRQRPAVSKKILFGGIAGIGLVVAALVAAFLIVSADEDPNLATSAPDLPTPSASTPTAAASATAGAASPTAVTAAATQSASAPVPTATSLSLNAPAPTATQPPAPTATPVPAGPVVSRFILDPAQSSSKFVITRTVLGSTSSAVATSNGVSGQFLVSENGLGSGGVSSFRIDMRTVSSNDSLTNSFLKSGEIDTASFPYADFVASATSPFSPGYGTGNQFSFTLSGTLTLNGVSRPVSWQVLARQSGSAFSATADTDILLSQFDVQVPNTPLGGARDQIHVQVLMIAQG